MIYDLIVIGGGAAGVFAALSAKAAHSDANVLLLEKSAVLLSKVRVSGGGRCNVTHACFDPLALTKHYPRGEKELIGPFHRFQPRNTIEWFEDRGVELKTEDDGRIFPVSDCSETIIQCLLSEAKKSGVEIQIRQKIENLSTSLHGFEIKRKDAEPIFSKNLLLATGSNAEGHSWSTAFGHRIEPPVPSLFTFNIPNSSLKELSGIALEDVELQIKDTPFVQRGPLLITHFGLSGPAALKLSAWGARHLHEKEYRVDLVVNWLPRLSKEEIFRRLLALKTESPQKMLYSENLFNIPKNLWKVFSPQKRMNDFSLKELELFAHKLHADTYHVEGKTTHKEEFVTCGGVCLKEVHFKTMESKLCPGLFFAGEILDIDGITGGFNFQNAWTTGFIAGSSIK